MHISEGILPLPQAAIYSVLATPFVIASFRQLRSRKMINPDHTQIPLPLIAAILFAATLLPVPVPVAGATSHMCAVPILALLFGPVAVIAPTAVVLALQALFFAHGGLTTLGANILTLGVIGSFSAVRFYRGFRALHLPWILAAGLSCALGDALVYVGDALILGQALSGQTSFGVITVSVLLGFAPVQAPLAILEGFLLSSSLVERVRADVVAAGDVLGGLPGLKLTEEAPWSVLR
jgi:cobalt/nickel transport system permease protein